VSLNEELNVYSTRLRHDALVGHSSLGHNAYTGLGRVVEKILPGICSGVGVPLVINQDPCLIARAFWAMWPCIVFALVLLASNFSS